MHCYISGEKNIVAFFVKNLFHFALKLWYLVGQKLLDFGLMLRFAPKVVTSCVIVAFYVNCLLHSVLTAT